MQPIIKEEALRSGQKEERQGNSLPFIPSRRWEKFFPSFFFKIAKWFRVMFYEVKYCGMELRKYYRIIIII